MNFRRMCGTIWVFLLLLTFPASPSMSQEIAGADLPDYPDSWQPALDRVPEADRFDFIESLKLAGENVNAILNVLLSCPDEWLPGAVFLAINLPVEDLTIISENLFISTLRDSYYAWKNYPWSSHVPEDIFLNYMLPPRVSQEPLEDWRGYFIAELMPRVEGMATASEVAEEIDRWEWENVGFQQTQKRDQGVFETLSGGYGRCEELMTLYICACRALGIPARQAWTPYWPHIDNNHAWSEVYAEDGRWHFIDAGKLSGVSNNGWFSGASQRANLIFSVPLGIPDDESSGDIYRTQDTPGARYSILNSIGFYKPSAELKVSVLDFSGNPVPGVNVVLSVYNWGALRPIATGTTDTVGIYRIEAGQGGYFVSVGNEETGACAFVQVDNQPVELGLMLPYSGIEPVPDGFWLRSPLPGSEVSE